MRTPTAILTALTAIVCSLFIAGPSAGSPSHYKGRIATKPNKTYQVRGNISAGKSVPSRWANTSSMACWPATRNRHFSGKHVLYTANLPRRATMTITLIPDKKSDLTLFYVTSIIYLRSQLHLHITFVGITSAASMRAQCSSARS